MRPEPLKALANAAIRAIVPASLNQPAIDRLERVAGMDPKNFVVQWNLCRAYRHAGQKSKALETITEQKGVARSA